MTLTQAQQQGLAPWDDLQENLQGVCVFRDRFPVAPNHLLFVPEDDKPWLVSMSLHMAYLRGLRMVESGECEAFNVGINAGAAAGQTVMYPHVHLIPRRSGDCEDPVGGVRAVISGQANYRKQSYRLPTQ